MPVSASKDSSSSRCRAAKQAENGECEAPPGWRARGRRQDGRSPWSTGGAWAATPRKTEAPWQPRAPRRTGGGGPSAERRRGRNEHLGAPGPCLTEEPSSDVHAHHGHAPASQLAGVSPGPAPEVEHPMSRPEVQDLDQEVDLRALGERVAEVRAAEVVGERLEPVCAQEALLISAEAGKVRPSGRSSCGSFRWCGGSAALHPPQIGISTLILMGRVSPWRRPSSCRTRG